MGADQTAEIRPPLRELFDALAKGKPDAESLCVTLEIPERPKVRVQVMHGTVNAAYPHTGDPNEFLRNAGIPLLPEMELDSWEPGLCATWLHVPCSVDTLAEFIDRLMVALHSLSGEDYGIDVTMENLA